jgi:putative ergosteryl-3beta-O-L-aspartate hydrolase
MSLSTTIALYLKVYLLRLVASTASLLDRYLSSPVPAKHAFTLSIPTLSRPQPSTINLLVYTPETYDKSRRQYPLVVNFHGGGYTIGTAADNARWAAHGAWGRRRCDPMTMAPRGRVWP